MKFKGRNKAIKKSSFSKPTHSQGKKHHISKGKNQKGNHSRVKAHNHEKHQQSRKSAFRGIFTDNKNMVTHSEERKKQNQNRKESDRINKLFIESELKKENPNLVKIKEHLKQITSRGLKQRIKTKIPRRFQNQ